MNTRKPALVGLCFLLLASPLAAQRVEVATHVSIATGTDMAAGVRADVTRGGWGVYSRWGVRTPAQACLVSLPPFCEFPADTGHEWAVGLSYSEAPPDNWRVYVSAGAGSISWNGSDDFLEAEVGLKRSLLGPVAFTVGLRSYFAPEVERARNGNLPIVFRHDVTFVELVTGLTLGLGSR